MHLDSPLTVLRAGLKASGSSAVKASGLAAMDDIIFQVMKQRPAKAETTMLTTHAPRAGVSSRAGVASPKAGVPSAKAGVVSGRDGVASPKGDVTCPAAGVVSAAAGVTFPAAGVAPPAPGVVSGRTGGSSKRKAKCPSRNPLPEKVTKRAESPVSKELRGCASESRGGGATSGVDSDDVGEGDTEVKSPTAAPPRRRGRTPKQTAAINRDNESRDKPERTETSQSVSESQANPGKSQKRKSSSQHESPSDMSQVKQDVPSKETTESDASVGGTSDASVAKGRSRRSTKTAEVPSEVPSPQVTRASGRRERRRSQRHEQEVGESQERESSEKATEGKAGSPDDALNKRPGRAAGKRKSECESAQGMDHPEAFQTKGRGRPSKSVDDLAGTPSSGRGRRKSQKVASDVELKAPEGVSGSRAPEVRIADPEGEAPSKSRDGAKEPSTKTNPEAEDSGSDWEITIVPQAKRPQQRKNSEGSQRDSGVQGAVATRAPPAQVVPAGTTVTSPTAVSNVPAATPQLRTKMVISDSRMRSPAAASSQASAVPGGAGGSLQGARAALVSHVQQGPALKTQAAVTSLVSGATRKQPDGASASPNSNPSINAQKKPGPTQNTSVLSPTQAKARPVSILKPNLNAPGAQPKTAQLKFAQAQSLKNQVLTASASDSAKTQSSSAPRSLLPGSGVSPEVGVRTPAPPISTQSLPLVRLPDGRLAHARILPAPGGASVTSLLARAGLVPVSDPTLSAASNTTSAATQKAPASGPGTKASPVSTVRTGAGQKETTRATGKRKVLKKGKNSRSLAASQADPGSGAVSQAQDSSAASPTPVRQAASSAHAPSKDTTSSPVSRDESSTGATAAPPADSDVPTDLGPRAKDGALDSPQPSRASDTEAPSGKAKKAKTQTKQTEAKNLNGTDGNTVQSAEPGNILLHVCDSGQTRHTHAHGRICARALFPCTRTHTHAPRKQVLFGSGENIDQCLRPLRGLYVTVDLLPPAPVKRGRGRPPKHPRPPGWVPTPRKTPK